MKKITILSVLSVMFVLVACDTATEIGDLGGGYSNDGNYIYFDGEVIEGVTPKNFEVIDDGLAKDDKAVYFLGGETMFDAESFEYLNSPYFKDKTGIYYTINFYKVEEADVDSFEALGTFYGKDKNTVFHHTKPFDADLETFEVLNSSFAKDKDKVYYNDEYEARVLAGADSETFEVFKNGYAKDKNTFYKYGVAIEDPDVELYN